MSKGRKRLYSNQYSKVLVIDGFTNDEHIRVVKRFLEKYGLSDAEDFLHDLIESDSSKMTDHEAIQVLDSHLTIDIQDKE